MGHRVLVLAIAATAFLQAAAAHAQSFPATVSNCGRDVVFETAPKRVVSIDVNITETLLALGLQDRIVGYGGLEGRDEMRPENARKLANIESLSDRYPSLEVVLGAQPDFVFAGWSYGFGGSNNVTPEVLSDFGIKSYAIRESCVRIQERDAVSIEDSFADILNIGRIFGVEERARTLIREQRARLAKVADAIGGARPSFRVFVYDSGDDAPFTAAAFAMPTALIELAGGINIFADVATSWTPVNWEDVVDRDPAVILVVDYGGVSAADKIKFLKAHPALKNVAAIRNENFVVAVYGEATPGVRNVDVVERLARAVVPGRF